MALAYGTGGSLNNCILYLDASNPKSYPGAGTTWYDLSGNNLNATLTNGPIWGGNNQGVINYDGTNDYAVTGTSANFNFSSSDFSVELWLYMNPAMGSGNLYHGVLSIGTTTGGETFLLGIWRSGLYPGCFFSTIGSTTSYMFGTNGNDPNYTGNYYTGLSKWTHVIITRNGNTCYFYLNGQLWASKATPAITSTSSNFVSLGLASAVYLIGQTPLLRIYNRALSSSEAFNNFAATRNRFVGTIPFAPTDISGLKLWLDADDSRTLFADTSGTTKATTDGTAVALWVDKSGNGNNVSQSTASARPAIKSSFTNGRNVLNFDGSNDTLIAPSSTATFKFLHSTGSTVFIVVQYKATGTYRSYFTTATSSVNVGYIIFTNTDNTTYLPWIAGGVSGNTVCENRSSADYIDATQPYLVCAVGDPTNATAANRGIGYKDGGAPYKSNIRTTAASTANSTYDLAIGSEGNTYYANVYIAEILAYNTILTASQRIQVETYLNNKWGLWSSFNPTSISGLQLWLDSSDSGTLFQDSAGVIPAINDGDPVGYWKDKSGNARDAAQTTTAYRPLLKTGSNGLNSKQALQFDGTNDYLYKQANLFSTTVTLFIVCQFNDNTSRMQAIDLKSNSGSFLSFMVEQNTYLTAGSRYGFYSSNNSNDSNIATSSGRHMFTIKANATTGNNLVSNTTYKVDGIVATLTNLSGSGTYQNLSSVNGYMIGAGNNDGVPYAGAGYLGGKIAEIIVYNSQLSDSDVAKVETYLNQKWGVF